MSLEIFLAWSWAMPSLMEHSMRCSLPEGYGSPASRDFREIPRLTSLDWKTSSTAWARSAELALMRIFSPEDSTEAPTPRKS